MTTPQHFQKLVLAVALVASGNGVAAQADGFMLARYQMGVPLSETKEYVDRNSWSGFTLGYRWLPDGDVTVGMDLGWQMFDKTNDYDTYTQGTASMSGIQYRYQNMFQFSGQAEFLMNEGGDLRPFVGVGVGGMYIYRLTSFGLYQVEQDPWQFMMKPSLGLSYYMSDGTALILGTEYVAGFKDKDLPGQSYLAVNLGFVFGTN